jgi:hypothetical protein
MSIEEKFYKICCLLNHLRNNRTKLHPYDMNYTYILFDIVEDSTPFKIIHNVIETELISVELFNLLFISD